jgi:Spy/CpxP family protein refolding chaperone
MSRAHLHAYRSQPGCLERRAKVNEIDNQSPAPASQSQRRVIRRRLVISGAAALVLVAGGAAGARAWTLHHFRPHVAWSSTQAIPVDLVEERIDHILKSVDATPDQQAKLHAIIEAALKDLDPLRQELAGTRKEMATLLGQPQIDRAAVEQLRSQRLAEMDQASKRMTQALLDAADVLTPDQRKTLADKAAEWTQHKHD